MDPIAPIVSQRVMRDSLTGALASDPVVHERTRRARRPTNDHGRRPGIDTMRRIAAAIARSFSARHERTHIHMGDRRRPYVCEAARCTSPGISPRDL